MIPSIVKCTRQSDSLCVKVEAHINDFELIYKDMQNDHPNLPQALT